MPIPLFTTAEKPSPSETQTSPTNPTKVTSTPLTSGSTLTERRRSSASEDHHHQQQQHHQEPLMATGSGTATSPASSGREQTKEEREAAQRLYEERIEDEYAKREGGA